MFISLKASHDYTIQILNRTLPVELSIKLVVTPQSIFIMHDMIPALLLSIMFVKCMIPSSYLLYSKDMCTIHAIQEDTNTSQAASINNRTNTIN
jgi:hypothetical protein